MKKSLLLGLLGLAATVDPSFGQGFIKLDNYNTAGPYVTYGSAGIPANGVGGAPGAVGGGLPVGWTAGLYYAQGDITGSLTGGNVAGFDDPTLENPGFVLGTGSGSTTGFASASTAGLSGTFFEIPNFQASAAVNSTVTVEIIAYPTASGSYASSVFRGHSAAFTMITLPFNAPTPTSVGHFMSSFSVFAVPEPSAFALAGMSGVTLLLFRRRR